MTEKSETRNAQSHVLSYINLRKAVGIIAIALPVTLITGKYLLDGPGLQISISAYYYTSMRNILVGSLCAIAVFLMSYRGYERKDDIAGHLACIFAVGIAFFPIAPEGSATSQEKIVSYFHMFFAGSFFLVLSYFSIVLFRKGSKNPTPQKKIRNRLYASCGIAIIICLIGIGASSLLLSETEIRQLQPVFWFEAIAIWAFGWAWFTKGEGILKDKEI